MVLASLLPGGSDFWLCGDGSCGSGVSPLFKLVILLFTIAKADCLSQRVLYYLSVVFAVYMACEAVRVVVPAYIVYLTVALFIGVHTPSLNGQNSYNLIGYTIFVTTGRAFGASTTEDVLVVSFLLVTAYLAYKIYINVLTLSASTPTPLIFQVISHIVPRYHFSAIDFFRADSPPPRVAAKRENAFKSMKKHWDEKWPKSLEISHYLSESFSDLRFAGSNRVFIPFMKHLESWCDPCTVIARANGVNLIDVDGEELIDVSGSYGVNTCGYEKYKEFISEGWDLVKDVGCVLGPVHPILVDNIRMLKEISGKEEVSFHMSGTEAVMCAVRLARFNTGKNLIVVFGGAYHGWWDGVQAMAGNERAPYDVLTLIDLNPKSLEIIKLRKNEIAAVLINPLQAFHPNAPPPSDLVLASNTRKLEKESDTLKSTENLKDVNVHTAEGYRAWLVKLRSVCSEAGVVLVFDEVYTGFRLAPGGAQEYFGVQCDMVVYGKTVGGGIPNGIVCGPRRLMKRTDEKKPLRVAYVIGTFSAHPILLGAMNRFLTWVKTDAARKEYDLLRVNVRDFVNSTNKILYETFMPKYGQCPIEVGSYSSVWTILYKIPGRYHWMLQYYLKDEGINLSWVGTGRLSFSLDFSKKDLESLQKKIVKACDRMYADGWWFVLTKEEEEEKTKQGGGSADMMIKFSLGKEMAMALLKRIFSA